MDDDRFERAIAMLASGSIEGALQEFNAMQEEAVDANEKSALMLNEVMCHLQLGCVADAEGILARIREVAPDDLTVRLNLDFVSACSAAQGGQQERALFQFETLLEQNVALLQTPDYRGFIRRYSV